MNAFCVKCNRGKPKGTWKPIEIQNPSIIEIKTRRGLRRIVRGTCPECSKPVTAIAGKEHEPCQTTS